MRLIKWTVIFLFTGLIGVGMTSADDPPKKKKKEPDKKELNVEQIKKNNKELSKQLSELDSLLMLKADTTLKKKSH
jgi:hypothetical protein